MGGEHPDWLPEGWRVSVKVRRYGRKDKYYVNLSNGLTFNSKPEVLRYLKSSGKSRKQEEPNKVDIKRTVAEKLPPGWIKEIRTKKKRGKTRRDPCYIDPISGRHFRSMQEVFRYLKSEGSGEAESKPDDKDHKNEESQDHSQSSSAEAKGQRLPAKKGDKNLTGHESVKSGPNVAALKSMEKPVLEQSGKQDDSVVGSLPNKLPEANGKKQQNGVRRQSTRLADGKQKDSITEDQSLKSGSEAVAEKSINIPENNGVEQGEKEDSYVGEGQQHKNVAQYKRKSLKSKWMSDLPRRTSKRLARSEADTSMKVITNNEAGASPRFSGEGEVTTKNVGKPGPSDEPEVDTTGKSGGLNDSNEHPLKFRTENPINNQQKKPITHENLSSLEEHKGVGVDSKEDQKHEKHLNSSLKDLFMDPCIEFAVKTLTGAIPIEDVNKVGGSPVSSLSSPNQTLASSSVFPSCDIWSDPCFEFAVKTLTGEIPTENGSQFQFSFQKSLSSSAASGCTSLTLPKFRLDSVYPSLFSQFDAVKKPFMRQQGVRDQDFPQSLNGSSQNSVDSGLHRRF